MRQLAGVLTGFLGLVALISGMTTLTRAESYVERGSYSVNVGTPTQLGSNYIMAGNSFFGVRGFNTSKGTLLSVQKNYSSTFSFEIQCLTDFGGTIAVVQQGFLSPSFGTSDFATFNSTLQEISTFGGDCCPVHACQTVGQTLSHSGRVGPAGFVLGPQSHPNTLLDFTRAASVPIQTWVGFTAPSQLPLAGTVNGIFAVKYNFTRNPSSVKPFLVGRTGTGKDRIMIGTDLANAAEYAALANTTSQARKAADECKRLADGIVTAIPYPSDTLTSPVREAIEPRFNLLNVATSTILELFKWGAKTDLEGCAAVLNRYANDPPDPNFLEVVQRGSGDLDMDLSTNLGAQYADLDEAFTQFGLGLESWDLFITSIERMQGALLANNIAAADLQQARAAQLLNEGETAFQEASVKFFDAASAFSTTSQELVTLALEMSGAASDTSVSSFLAAVLSSVTIRQLTCAGPLPPFDKPLTIKEKASRTIPVKIVLKDSTGYVMTDQNVAPPPVLVVSLNQTLTGSALPDDTSLLQKGSANTQNVFRYDPTSLQWIYNLVTGQFSTSGKYTVQVRSGDATKYTLAEGCTQTFERLQ